MSYGESNERKQSRQSFRTVMDLGMGIFYVAIGTILIIARKIGLVDVPWLAAYPLGFMMAVGGAFRFYRGFMAVLPGRKRDDNNPVN